MKLGVVGLPNVGKSTLFNAITKAGAECANYPFCTIEPNVGMVSVPDFRLANLAKLYNCTKITPAVIEFVDIAGLVKGASKGDGLGNKFLSHIREVDAICHVVRCFDSTEILHVENSVDPKRDIEIIEYELIMADLETIDKRFEKAEKNIKVGVKGAELELDVLKRIKSQLENGKPVRLLEFNEEEDEIVKSFFLLTSKPVIYVANIGENDLLNPENKYVKSVKEIANSQNSQVIVLCAKIEEELASLDDEDKEIFSKVPFFNFLPVQQMQGELLNKFNDDRWKQLKKISGVHKLTHKQSVLTKKKEIKIEGTFFEHILEEFK